MAGKITSMPDAKKIAKLEEPQRKEVLSKIDSGISPKLAIQETVRDFKFTELGSAKTDTCTIENIIELAQSGKKFGCIYIDPPWQYGNQSTRGSTDNHYPTMTTAEISRLPVEELAADQSHLHLWTTNGFLKDALDLLEGWGFEYKGMLIWVKPQMGMGNYWRVSHEILLLGVRGNLGFMDRGQKSWIEVDKAEYSGNLELADRDGPKSWFKADRTEHSSKPERVREMLEKVSPPPYLELFARQTCPHWTSWGNQIERTLFDYGAEEGGNTE
jgi:N6-adenosine-specific RNA methylase IME4